MKVLAIDTSGKILSAALVEDEEILVEKNKRAGKNHSRLLLRVIEELLREENFSLKDLDGLAVSLGPGSFTGLRIGVTTVKGLAFAAGLPVVGVPTLDIIARNVRFYPGVISPLIDARRGNVYTCFYRFGRGRLKRESRHLLISCERFLERIGRKSILVLGDGIDTYGELIRSKNKNVLFAPRSLWFPRASEAALLAQSRFKTGKTDNPQTLTPLYLYSHRCSITRHPVKQDH